MNGRMIRVTLRKILPGVLAWMLLTTGCNLPAQTPPTPEATTISNDQAAFTPLPSETLSNISPTALIPVTGLDEVTLQCQFCVNDEPHAVLIIPELASYYTSETTSRITCLTIQVTNGRRILLCRGASQSSFHLNVCYSDANCLQFPVTLDVCPLAPQAGIARSPTPFVLTPINNVVLPATLTYTSTAAAVPTPTILAATGTQTVVAPPPVLATTPASTGHANPIRPGTQQPGFGLQDPGEFARWYFGAVWQSRNYQDLWENYLTPSFKTRSSAASYDEYMEWWSSVERVDIHSVTVIQNDGTHAWIHVIVTFTMKDGRVISNQEYDYDLLYDPVGKTWMFDYIP
jgi:hypothetical protein